MEAIFRKRSLFSWSIFLFLILFLSLVSAIGNVVKADEISDLSVDVSDTTPSSTATYTISFTLPYNLTTSDSLSLNFPYVELYEGGTYSSDTCIVDDATITTSQFSVSYQYSNYVYLIPDSDLSSGTEINITVSGVDNPSLEGTGSFYIYGYGSNYFSGYNTIRYDDPSTTDDLTITVTDSDGSTPLSSVWVYLSYYDYNNYDDYEYYSAQTDSSGEALFNGLTEDREYELSFYYDGSATDNTAPQATTLEFASSGQTEEYSFIAANVTTHYCEDSSCNSPVADAWWYVQDSNWNWITSGNTDSEGLISVGLSDGSYTLYIYDEDTWNYNDYSFTVSGGSSSGLDDPITPPTPNVTGQVLADNTGASGVYLYVYSDEVSNDGMWTYEYSYTDDAGNFSFSLSNTGTYSIYVDNWGLPEGYSAPSATQITLNNVNTAIDPVAIDLVQNTKTISGNVTKADGSVVDDAYIYWYNNSGGYAYSETDSTGAYTVSLSGGTWYGYVSQMSWPSTWAYVGGNLKVEFSNDDSEETETKNIQVSEYDATITGRIIKPNGSAVSEYGASVSASGDEVWSWDDTDSSGNFSLSVIGGVNYDLYISTSSQNYGAPDLDSVSVESGETYNLGDITLLERNSQIKGSVTLNSGEAVNDAYIYSWKSGGSWDWASANTDEAGAYTLNVIAGTHEISTWADYGMDSSSARTYSYLDGSLKVVVAENETSTGNNFVFYENDSTLNFRTISYDGSTSSQVSGEYGWVSLSNSGSDSSDSWYGSMGCYLSGGSCEVDVPAGTYNVSYYSYSGWGYGDTTSYTFSGLEENGSSASAATASTGDTTTYDLVLLENDVTVTGNFIDADGNSVDDLYYGEVYATNGSGGYAYAWVSMGGSYTLNLSAGTWYLNYWIDPYSGYMSSGAADVKKVVSSGDSIEQDFTLLELNSSVTVNTKNPDGDILTNAFVNISTKFGENETSTYDDYGLINIDGYTDSNGEVDISAPAGTYYVSAYLPVSEGYLNPEPRQVTIDSETSGNLTFTFVESDATISGIVTDSVGMSTSKYTMLSVGDAVEGAFITAYSPEEGYYTEAETDVNGAYSLNVLQGETWYVRGIKEATSAYYYSDQSSLEVDEEAESLDLILSNSATVPESQTVVFQSNQPKVITLSDGMELNIPANALSASTQQVTVMVTPVAQLAYTANSQPLTYGYDLKALDANGDVLTQFASDVTISIPYNEDNLPEGATEDDLKPEYFVSSGGTWGDTTYTVDADNNVFVIVSDHFSKFAVNMGTQGVEAGEDDGEINDGDDTNNPDKITGLKAKYRKVRKLKLKWTADDNASYYKVQLRYKKSGKKIKTFTVSKTNKVIKKKWTKSNKAYKFRVRGVNDVGEKGEWSSYKKIRTKPKKVKKLKVVKKTDSSAVVKFNKPRGTIKKYLVKIYKGKSLVKKYRIKKKLKKKKKKKKITGLESGVKYTVKVRATFNKKNKSKFRQKKFTTL